MKSGLTSILFAVLAIGCGGSSAPLNEPASTDTACTEEAKECPDGSFVARTGPECEFAACPEAADKPSAAASDEQCSSDADCSEGESCKMLYACDECDGGRMQCTADN